MTKSDVISQIAEQTGIDKADVQVTVEAFFSVIKNSMAEGDNIYVRGFGSFINKKRAKKIARNISKNTAIVIDEHYVPAFKPSKVFVEKIKKSGKLKLKTLAGTTLTATLNGEDIILADAKGIGPKILKGSIEASNGSVYVIDSVLGIP